MEAQLYNVTYQWATPRFRKGGEGYFLGAEIFGQNYQATYLQQEYQRIN